MMCCYCINNKRGFLILLAKVYTNFNVRSFNLMINRLTNIMKQACTFRHTYVYANLSCKQAGKLRNLDGVLQCILSIA